jgi:hypothetical protein
MDPGSEIPLLEEQIWRSCYGNTPKRTSEARMEKLSTRTPWIAFAARAAWKMWVTYTFSIWKNYTKGKNMDCPG